MRYIPLSIALMSAALGLAACQAPGSAPGPESHAREAGPICLPSYQIRRTDVRDDSNILFVMLNGRVYNNHLLAPCPSLRSETRGFTYEASDPGSDTICSNLVTIRLNTSRSVCQLGAFTDLGRPARP